MQQLKPNKNRQKECIWCKAIFFDTSKRLSQNTCSKECAYANMVDTRKKRGSYERTEQQNKKLSKTMQEGYLAGKYIICDEKRVEISRSMKEAWKAGRYTNEKFIQNKIKKWGHPHHMMSDYHKERNSKLHKGRQVSEETRIKLSKKAQNQVHNFSRCHGGFREDLNLYVRSSWEANYARFLNYIGVKWEYEAQTFSLTSCSTYTPDFRLGENHFIEVKGWLTAKGKHKLEQFSILYPHVKLEIIDRQAYRELYNKYENIIPNWEKITT
jgi:hypothetical protein